MNHIFYLFFLVFSYSFYAQEIPIPKNHSIISSVYGDLDKDGNVELVVAYNSEEINEQNENVPRTLIIYKKNGNKWRVWEQSNDVLLESRDGGMMGDPFAGIEIKNNALNISHYGGSRWKWGFTEKYRFQNNAFYLIGYTSMSGTSCEYWLNSDFNLSTGKLIFSKEYEDCENSDHEIYKVETETLFKKGLKITLQNRASKAIEIVSPKYKFELHLF